MSKDQLERSSACIGNITVMFYQNDIVYITFFGVVITVGVFELREIVYIL